KSGDRAGAIDVERKAIKLLEALVVEEPKFMQAQADLAEDYGDLGRALGEGDEAVAALEEAARRWDALVEKTRGHPMVRFFRGQAAAEVAERGPGAPAERLAVYDRVAKEIDELLAIEPGNADWAQGKAVLLRRRGDAIGGAEAQAAYREALAILDGLLAKD